MPSQCEMVTGPNFSSRNQPYQGRTTAYRDNSGPNSRPAAHCATIVGDWEESSGESLVNFLCKTVNSASFNHNLIQHKVSSFLPVTLFRYLGVIIRGDAIFLGGVTNILQKRDGLKTQLIVLRRVSRRAR